MTATLTFNLPEDQEEFHGMSHASDFWDALWDMDQHFRSIQKYAPDLEEKQQELVDELRERFWDILREHNVTLEEYS